MYGKKPASTQPPPKSLAPRPTSDLRWPTIADVRWRVDVTISTSAMQRVLQPSVLMELEMSDGTLEQFELSLEKFHELRYSVARTLKEMEDLEKQPILRVK